MSLLHRRNFEEEDDADKEEKKEDKSEDEDKKKDDDSDEDDDKKKDKGDEKEDKKGDKEGDKEKKKEVEDTPEEEIQQSLVMDKEKDESDTKKICEHIEPVYIDELKAKTDGFECTSEKENIIVTFKVDADNKKLLETKTKSGGEPFKKKLNKALEKTTHSISHNIEATGGTEELRGIKIALKFDKTVDDSDAANICVHIKPELTDDIKETIKEVSCLINEKHDKQIDIHIIVDGKVAQGNVHKELETKAFHGTIKKGLENVPDMKLQSISHAKDEDAVSSVTNVSTALPIILLAAMMLFA